MPTSPPLGAADSTPGGAPAVDSAAANPEQISEVGRPARTEKTSEAEAMPGGWEWLIIVGVLLLLFGAKRLPEMARSVGQSARVFNG